jgi:hypothetical protein
MRQITWRTRIPEVDNNSNALGNADKREHNTARIMPWGYGVTHIVILLPKMLLKKLRNALTASAERNRVNHC